MQMHSVEKLKMCFFGNFVAFCRLFLIHPLPFQSNLRIANSIIIFTFYTSATPTPPSIYSVLTNGPWWSAYLDISRVIICKFSIPTIPVFFVDRRLVPGECNASQFESET